MDERWEEWAGDDVVRETRRAVHDDLAAFLRALAAAPTVRTRWTGERLEETPLPPMRSALVSVAQYWADNANDEVHSTVTVSPHETPAWPHRCGELGDEPDDDGCHFCCRLDEPRWPYGVTIPALEAFCHERGNQNAGDAWNALPFAVARLGADGSVTTELVGRLVRPWLDLPRTRAPALPLDERVARLAAAARDDAGARAVLADALEERGDARGELIALSALAQPTDAQRARRDALVVEVGRAWLGAWDPHVPRAGLRWEGGLPSEVELWIEPNDARWQLDRDEAVLWSVARSVRFLPTSARVVLPSMAPLRALGPLDDEALAAIGESDLPFAVEELELEPSGPDTIEALRAVDDWLPRLRVLRLVGEDAGSALLPALRRWRRLSSLARLEVAGTFSEAAHAAEVAAWCGAGLGVPLRVAQLDEDTRRVSGWAISVAGDTARLERAGLLASATAARADALLAALPRTLRVVDDARR